MHEHWAYDEAAGVQSLRRLIALCSACHEVTHVGLANVKGRTEEAFAHLRQVTGMSRPEADRQVRAAEQIWIDRSAREWQLDLNYLLASV